MTESKASVSELINLASVYKVFIVEPASRLDPRRTTSHSGNTHWLRYEKSFDQILLGFSMCSSSKILSCDMNILLTEIILLLMFFAIKSNGRNSDIAEVLHRPIRSLSFPDGSNTAMFFALATPLEQPYQSISLAYFFEADYTLPTNFTYYEPWMEPLRRRSAPTKRSIDRTLLYQIIERKLEGAGFNGHECLLRTICETSQFSVRHNGLIGDIFHILFTPTSSRHEELPQDILQAERVGRNGWCRVYRAHCPVGLFDLIAVPE